MDITGYPDHEILIETVRRFVAKEITPHIEEWERERHFPDSVFRILGEQGFHGLLIPEEDGGLGGDYEMAAAWCEAFGEAPSVGLTVAVNMHSLVVTYAIARFGSSALKEQWLPRALTGKAIGAYAFTEPNAGSDLAGLQTKAEKFAGGWKINGAKTFITNGARAQFILVLCRTTHEGKEGYTTFVVDTSLAGFKVTRKLEKLGWWCSDTAELHFENLEVPDEAVLGEVGAGWEQAAKSLLWERLMLTLTAHSGARCCYNQARAYASERQAFGQPIDCFDAIGALFDEMETRLALGDGLMKRALHALMIKENDTALVCAAKRSVCEDAIWIADQAIQIHGGYGYTTEFLPERWWRDLRLMTIGGGTSQIMGNIVSKEMGL